MTALQLSTMSPGMIRASVAGWGTTNNTAEVPLPGAPITVFPYVSGYMVQPPETEWAPGDPIQVYEDQDLTTPMDQPLTTDAYGVIPGWIDDADAPYDVVLTYEDGYQKIWCCCGPLPQS